MSQGPRTEDGVCVYAIGDIHGRLDLLRALLERIGAHARTLPAGVRPRLVLLGDYIDRGPDSRGVLDLLAAPPSEGFERVCLKGNHEDFLLDFLEHPGGGLVWLSNGGLETLASYGVPTTAAGPAMLPALASALRAAMPLEHRRFLAELDLLHVCGDYLFVHAGLDPRRPLHQQGAGTLLWIREPFLSSEADFGYTVVHGHSISYEPDVRRNRIGIDTGAFATGRLTCLVLHGEDRMFLMTETTSSAAS